MNYIIIEKVDEKYDVEFGKKKISNRIFFKGKLDFPEMKNVGRGQHCQTELLSKTGWDIMIWSYLHAARNVYGKGRTMQSKRAQLPKLPSLLCFLL